MVSIYLIESTNHIMNHSRVIQCLKSQDCEDGANSVMRISINYSRNLREEF